MIQPSRAAAALLALGCIIGAVYASTQLAQSTAVVNLIEQFGYLGVVIIAIIAGLNFIVPIPAATLAPVYSAAGLIPMVTIAALVIGTVIADLIGYALGHSTKSTIQKSYPTVIKVTERINGRPLLLTLVVICYAAFVPFPNEAIVIPLAALGVSWRRLIIPLIIGNIIHQTLLVVGVNWLSTLW